ncbi:unnamed protein product [Pleuronectes platessa]|uniref:Secreted protein n=1 Tax=Pleuronectes platessa TaxID=8262 RepID=A0A9N7UHP6_PLEPL|nr:unnamed protein product [Pleuronectes platessa]
MAAFVLYIILLHVRIVGGSEDTSSVCSLCTVDSRIPSRYTHSFLSTRQRLSSSPSEPQVMPHFLWRMITVQGRSSAAAP